MLLFLEVSGDALIRKCIYHYTGTARTGFALLSGLFLFGYGFSLNLAPVPFRQVVGLYIATLFIVWQVGTYIFFHTAPTWPILIGGTLIISGGLIVTFWKSA